MGLAPLLPAMMRGGRAGGGWLAAIPSGPIPDLISRSPLMG